MSIRVLFFGATAEVVGERDIQFETHESVEMLLVQIVADYPRLASHKLLISINQQYASGEAVLNNGDEVAIFTAVSGG